MSATDARSTFAGSARREQLIDCAIGALSELGYQQTSIAEVARRAGVSKGVVTYHFPARDDLIWSVTSRVFDSITASVGSRIEAVAPARFIETYLTAWVDFYRDNWREMSAIAEIWVNFRDPRGQPHLGARTLGHERRLVESALAAGQADGSLRAFSPTVMAVTLKAALDGLLAQLALEPALDLDAYRDELLTLFESATSRPRRTMKSVAARSPARKKEERQ